MKSQAVQLFRQMLLSKNSELMQPAVENFILYYHPDNKSIWYSHAKIDSNFDSLPGSILFLIANFVFPSEKECC